MPMLHIVKRNLRLFFRDKTSVFFSLLSVFIIIGLYVLFLGRMMINGMEDMLGDSASFIIYAWVMAGILSVVSITSTLGAFHTMVEDRTRNISKDFMTAPIRRSQLVGGYVISSFIVGVIMSIAALILAEIVIVVRGGDIMGIVALLKLLGVMLLSVFASSAMVFFIVSFFRSSSAFSTASAIIGTLIGFLTGIYIPIGSFPSYVQTVIKVFPISHSAALFRQIMMEEPMQEAFKNAPEQVVNGFKESMGVIFYFGDYEVTPLISMIILVATGIIFLLLTGITISVKKK